MSNTTNILPEATPLTELMAEIKKENHLYKEVDIQNAVSEVVKQYLPTYESKLGDIKTDALASLNWNAAL